MVSYYANYLSFVTEYPRFNYTSISYDTLRNAIPKIKKWFSSEKCKSLIGDIDICLTPGFWKETPDTFMDGIGFSPENKLDDFSFQESDGEASKVPRKK